MINTILGRKLGMTQIFDDEDNIVPVTVIEAGPCYITQIKTQEKDGYDAVQLGFSERKPNKVNKPSQGHFKKAGVAPQQYIKEVRLSEPSDKNVGDTVSVDIFSDVKAVDVIGTSKGKGYQGTIKRWNFNSGSTTHGSRNQRRPGSIGQASYPARVRKGLHMSGHMGTDRVTVKNLKVVRVDPEQNLLLVKGAVPGAKNGFVQIRMA